MRPGSQTRGRHVDTGAKRRAGLSFVLLVAPFVAVVVVLIPFGPEDDSLARPALWAVAALLLAALWGGEWLIVQRVRRRREREATEESATSLPY